MMAPREDPPDVERLARSMLSLRGDHDDHDQAAPTPPARRGQSKAPASTGRPGGSAAVRDATQADRDRYLTSGLQPVDCRFCHVTVNVKKPGPGHTAVQWNSEASQRCAVFAELRASGEHSARTRSCPKLTDSIEHAIAEGCLEAVSTAPPPGDG
ncbi:hypothetical protein [Mycobacterium sp.]|uniref:hypothetical protein n=1 Tax=Mycobacterium sp. TaxID=1785 RepID=UPI003CC67C0A